MTATPHHATSIFLTTIERAPSGWWAHLWLRDHVEYFGPYRWRWVARAGAWWWLWRVRGAR